MMINMTSILYCRGHNYLGTVIELPPYASETRRHTREQIEIMSNEAAQCLTEVSMGGGGGGQTVTGGTARCPRITF